MKRLLLKLSLVFAVVCMCVSLAACSSKTPQVNISTRVENFSATYDKVADASKVNVSVSVTNASDGADISGFSYSVRFLDVNGNVLYEQSHNYSEHLSSGSGKAFSNEYTVTGQVASVTAIPGTATAVPEEDSDSGGCSGSDSSSGGCGTGATVGGGSASGLLVLLGIYVAYKYLFSDN